MVFWMIGDLSNTQPRFMAWTIWLVVLGLMLYKARDINIAAMHADNLAFAGVNDGSTAPTSVCLCSFVDRGAVSTASSIGFVGLIIPHA